MVNHILFKLSFLESKTNLSRYCRKSVLLSGNRDYIAAQVPDESAL